MNHKANKPEELMEWIAAGAKPKSDPPVAGAAHGSAARKPRRKYPKVKCPGCGRQHALIDGRIWNHIINGEQCSGTKMPLPLNK